MTPLTGPSGLQLDAWSMELETLSIDIYFDFVCPWCFIGKRHLAAAVAQLAVLKPQLRVQTTWRSQQLLPDIPPGGVAYQPFYIARLGSAEAVAARRAQVQEAARPAGLHFAFDQIQVMPNTAAAHDVVARAAETGTQSQQSQLIERIFAAYFLDGADIGDPAVLDRLSSECGIPVDGQERGSGQLRRSAPAVGGVPFFVFNQSIALSGAAAPAVLLDGMLKSVAR
jgi:predicted DsbA family dithiol-disulfide isomerase